MAASLAPGAILKERYRITRTVGEGAMGVVYEAEDLTIPGARWALKEMDADALTCEELQETLARFERECAILSKLNHTGLPKVIEHFARGPRHYLVMEFIEGESLERKLARRNGPFNIEEILPWIYQVIDILEYLHGHRPPIIYRDLKPSNIVITAGGKAKLVDFGIARTYDPARLLDTQQIGTPGYSAPEQYGLNQTDSRSDIYSLGATMFCLLSGEDPAELNFQFPPLQQFSGGIPPGIASAVSKALDDENMDRIITLLDGHPELARNRSENGRTALAVAASGGNKALVRMLLDLGAGVDFRDLREYRTPLHYACLGGQVEVVELLLRKEADVNATDREGATPLHFAIAGNHEEIIRKLKSLGAREEVSYSFTGPGFQWGMLTPLVALPIFILLFFGLSWNNVHMAANRGDLRKVRSLIESNPSLLNAPSAKLSETPLHEAAGTGRLEVVKYLVEKGADCHLRDASGETALEKAIGRRHNDVARFLFPHTIPGKEGDEDRPLQVAADYDNMEAVEFLLETGCDVNYRDKHGETALHCAVMCDSTDLVKLLIEEGADVNASYSGKGGLGKTPLHYARSDRIVRILVRKGAEVNAKDIDGRTPLHCAAEGFGSAVEELIACAAQVNARDNQGKTPLWYARSYRYSKKVIEDHGGKL